MLNAHSLVVHLGGLKYLYFESALARRALVDEIEPGPERGTPFSLRTTPMTHACALRTDERTEGWSSKRACSTRTAPQRLEENKKQSHTARTRHITNLKGTTTSFVEKIELLCALTATTCARCCCAAGAPGPVSRGGRRSHSLGRHRCRCRCRCRHYYCCCCCCCCHCCRCRCYY